MKNNICIIGLGYVGLPLCLAFSKKNKVIGYDIDFERVSTLKKGIDINNDLESFERKLLKNKNIIFTNNPKELINANIFIITVPTPINKKKNPDFKPLISATKIVSKYIKKGDIVIYESTVYPGATEEVCLPVIENLSKLILNKDFYLGYSPERLSPGDREHGLKKIIKITSGSSLKALKIIDGLYKSIISKGTYPVKSIKIAEAAKVIENTQRDLNIAFVNELSKIFNKLNINTKEVLEAAGTKWNFAKFQPGMVGGHCIAIDPYYLKFKSFQSGYISKLILPARKLNDSMPKFICDRLLKSINFTGFNKKKIKLLVMGFAYKENSSDTRNTPVFDIYRYLHNKKKIKHVDIMDPLVRVDRAKKNFGINLHHSVNKKYDGIILAVPHKKILKYLKNNFKKITKKNTKILDIKYLLKQNNSVIPL
jgi:UDP-N-acetyl-D-galactosamine dehydrogenase